MTTGRPLFFAWLIRTGETLKTRDKNADALVMSVLDD